MLSKCLSKMLDWCGFSEPFVRLLLKELRLLKVRIFVLLSLRQRKAIRRARKEIDLKVNLGCGDVSREGWIGIDSSFQSNADWYVDLRNGVPLGDQSCSHLFCEHFLEHLAYPEELKRFLADCFRVLRDGGVFRIVVPDASKFMRAYCEGNQGFLKQASAKSESPMEASNSIFYGDPLGEHHYAYDFDTLKRLLGTVGFKEVSLIEFRKGGIARALDRQDITRILESLYVEAIR